MKLRPLLILVAALAAVDAALWWRDEQRHQAAPLAADGTLLDVATIERARRIVIREKPQSRVIEKNKDGFEVRLTVAPDAPIRETVLERQGDGPWTVPAQLGLEADATWLAETLRDLTRGRLVRHITADPGLAQELSLHLGEVRLDDEDAQVLRRLEFGRKDGGEAYQFVRIDRRDVYMAKHEAVLLGDALTWVAGRVFRLDVAQVAEVELPFGDRTEAPVRLTRTAPEAPFTIDGRRAGELGAQLAQTASGLLREPALAVFAPDSAAVTTARQNIVAQIKVRLFDGRTYAVEFGAPAPNADLGNVEERNLVIGFWTCSDAADVMARQSRRGHFAYDRGALGTLPKNRAVLSAAGPSARP